MNNGAFAGVVPFINHPENQQAVETSAVFRDLRAAKCSIAVALPTAEPGGVFMESLQHAASDGLATSAKWPDLILALDHAIDRMLHLSPRLCCALRVIGFPAFNISPPELIDKGVLPVGHDRGHLLCVDIVFRALVAVREVLTARHPVFGKNCSSAGSGNTDNL